jgi:DNA-binding transcriptional ArsR family regulator
MKKGSNNRNEAIDDLVFKALAGPERRKILDLLRDGPMTTGQLCNHLDRINRCTVMQHLGVLENAQLVIARKSGRQRWNHLDVSPIQRIHERWIASYAAPSASLLSRWKRDIECAGKV